MKSRVVPQHVLDRASTATPDDPLRIACSACLVGQPVGFDGSSWPHELLLTLLAHPSVEHLAFCPEDHGLGTPRPWMAIANGDGHAVIDGEARIIDLEDTDVTAGFLKGGAEMRDRAVAMGAHLAVLMNTSPSCSVHVLHRQEAWPERAYRKGLGSTAAFLDRAGIPLVSNRDLYSLHSVLAAVDPTHAIPDDVEDFPDNAWYRETFGP